MSNSGLPKCPKCGADGTIGQDHRGIWYAACSSIVYSCVEMRGFPSYEIAFRLWTQMAELYEKYQTTASRCPWCYSSPSVAEYVDYSHEGRYFQVVCEFDGCGVRGPKQLERLKSIQGWNEITRKVTQ